MKTRKQKLKLYEVTFMGRDGISDGTGIHATSKKEAFRIAQVIKYESNFKGKVIIENIIK